MIEPADTKIGPLSKVQVGAYAVASFSALMIYQPLNLYIPQLYAKELGFSLAALGTVLVATQIFDAISQQICGFLCDRTRTRWGPRKPWVAFGATLTIVAAYFLFRPPPEIGLAYFIVWKMIYDFGHTSKAVAYSAWGAELTTDYRERSRFMGATGFFGKMGVFANEILPIMLFWLGLTASSAYSMQVMSFYFIAALATIPLYTITLTVAPVGSAAPVDRPDFLGMLRSLRANRPFWRYLTAFSLSGLGLGALALNFTFYDGYLRVGEWFPYLMTIYSITGLLSIPLWVWVANRYMKHRAYSVAMVIGGCAPLGWLLIDPATTQQSAIIAYGAIVVFLIGLGVGCNFVTISSILADVSDYGTVKSGERRTAGYFAFYLLVNKVAIAIGGGLALAVVGWFGYDAKAGAVNSETAKFGLLMVVSVVPAILKVAAARVMWGFTLTPARHATVQRILKRREDRVARTLALSTASDAGRISEPILAPAR